MAKYFLRFIKPFSQGYFIRRPCLDVEMNSVSLKTLTLVVLMQGEILKKNNQIGRLIIQS